MQDLVSIITPCYNGEEYISRFLNSILNQDYSNIELILIDDGSTDNTAEIIQDYSIKFNKKGYSLIYIFQENQGQACALNKGLKIFKGNYLTWPDSDDFLSTDAISLRVDFLKNNSKYGFVRSDAAFYNEKNLNHCIRLATSNIQDKYREKLFDDLIFEKNAYVCNGCYMVRRSSFLVTNPVRSIYESRAGQNWQILIPLAFEYYCGYIDLPLYHVIERSNSHSRTVRCFDAEIERCGEHHHLLLEVISHLAINHKRYQELIDDKYNRKRFKISCRYQKLDTALHWRRRTKSNSLYEFFKFSILILKLKLKLKLNKYIV